MPERSAWKEEVARRLASLRLDPAREAEIVDELSQHLEDRFQELIAAGVSEVEARQAAFEELSDPDAPAQDFRRVEGEPRPGPVALGQPSSGNLLADLWRDLRYSCGQMRRHPGFAAVAIITLALGIGVNTAIFSVYDSFLIAPAPVPSPQQVVTLASRSSPGFSYPDFEEIHRRSKPVFSGVAADIRARLAGMDANGMSQSILTSYVSWNFFELLRAKPVIGNLAMAESADGPSTQPVVVLSYTLWKTRFGGDPRVIGKSVLIDGHPFTIIGVVQRGFYAVLSPIAVQAYLPLGMARVLGDVSKGFATDPGGNALRLVARLQPEIRLASARPLCA